MSNNNRELPDHPIFERIPDLWHTIVETMDEALFLVDTHRDIVYFNRRAAEITGYRPEEVIGRHCLAGFRCPRCAQQCGLFEQERLTDAEVEITRKDGTTVVALKNAVVLRNEEGEIVGGLETFRDISALREQMKSCSLARAHAEDREQTLEAVLGSISEGIVALDGDHQVVSVSRRAREILGIDDEETAIGQRCSEVLGSALCAQGCPLDAPRSVAHCESHRRTTLEVGGRQVRVSEGVTPMLDDEGRPLGHLIILTELPEGPSGPEESFYGLIGRSPAMVAVFERVRQLSHSEVTVLITGESGTGKELAARAIHETSPRAGGTFLAVNCAALPEGLLESEIFGHVKGAFTGAMRDRKGRVELADGGTLFLDEVGELPLALQTKLLRLVQERTFERLGEEQTRQADIRIIAATNRDLAASVEAGTFRDDLYYRLKVVPLRMPPLRERGRDVALIAARLLDRHARAADRTGLSFTREALELLQAYTWPGNVRELVNTVEFVVALTQGDAVTPADLPPELHTVALEPKRSAPSPTPRPSSRSEATARPAPADEAELIRQALEHNQWHRLKTAEELGINRVTLYRLMQRHGISGPRGRRRTKLASRLAREQGESDES